MSALIRNTRPLSPEYASDIESLNDRLRRLIQTILREISFLGIPSENDVNFDKSVNVTVNQEQQQDQNQNSEINIFLESIEDELTGKQLKELKEIAKNEPDPELAKPKILEKLKSFGEGIVTKVLTNIITNPAVWTGIIG